MEDVAYNTLFQTFTASSSLYITKVAGSFTTFARFGEGVGVLAISWPVATRYRRMTSESGVT